MLNLLLFPTLGSGAWISLRLLPAVSGSFGWRPPTVLPWLRTLLSVLTPIRGRWYRSLFSFVWFVSPTGSYRFGVDWWCFSPLTVPSQENWSFHFGQTVFDAIVRYCDLLYLICYSTDFSNSKSQYLVFARFDYIGWHCCPSASSCRFLLIPNLGWSSCSSPTWNSTRSSYDWDHSVSIDIAFRMWLVWWLCFSVLWVSSGVLLPLFRALIFQFSASTLFLKCLLTGCSWCLLCLSQGCSCPASVLWSLPCTWLICF